MFHAQKFQTSLQTSDLCTAYRLASYIFGVHVHLLVCWSFHRAYVCGENSVTFICQRNRCDAGRLREF
jgi:hypothetical protein